MSAANTSLVLLKRQRSHRLFVFSDAQKGRESAFLDWYESAYRQQILPLADVLNVELYVQHDVDITQGRYAPLPLRYLSLIDVSLDGADKAGALIERITAQHREQSAAKLPATWIYYPVSEKVGPSPPHQPSMLTLAFANATRGQEAEFREWYATRHIRHALHIPALVSGQCFERTQFQNSGALEARFNTIAVYEQVGPPESIIESFASLPPGTLDFPMLDLTRFAEWVYRPL